MEMVEYYNKTPGEEGVISVAFDVSSGMMRAAGAGFWSVAQATAFFDDWKSIVGRIQRAGHRVSAIVDLSDGAVQKVEVANIIARIGDGLYLPGDAVVMLVPNRLAKMQMRRVLDTRFHDFFLSRAAAEAWLQSKAIRTPGPWPDDHDIGSLNFFGTTLFEAGRQSR